MTITTGQTASQPDDLICRFKREAKEVEERGAKLSELAAQLGELSVQHGEPSVQHSAAVAQHRAAAIQHRAAAAQHRATAEQARAKRAANDAQIKAGLEVLQSQLTQKITAENSANIQPVIQKINALIARGSGFKPAEIQALQQEATPFISR